MKLLWRLVGLMRPVMGWMVLGGLLSIITLIANVVLMATSGWFIASMAIAGAHGITINYFTPAGIIRFSAIVRTAGRYAERLVTHSATLRILSGLRVWLYERIEPLAPAGLEDFRSGDLLSRIGADIDTLDQFYLRLLLPVIVALVSSLVLILFLAFFDPLLMLIEAALLFTAGVLMPLLSNHLSSDNSQQIQQLSGSLRTHQVEYLQGMGELLIDGADERYSKRLDRLSSQLIGQQQHISQINGLSQAMVGLLANLAMWLIMIIAIPMVEQGSLPPAHLAMLVLFSLASFEAVAPLPMAFQTLGQQLAAAKRIFQIADRQPSIKEPNDPEEKIADLTLNLYNISYRYPQDRASGIEDISLQLAPGKKIALLGPSGCGKSTLLQLILKFRIAERGRLSLGGITYDRLSGVSIRSNIAVSTQTSHLFNTTIGENLRLGSADASQSDLQNACRIAQIDDFIQTLPEGYNTEVGELGVRLSSGQQRRLTLARALLKQAPILILDEPTEGLDSDTERRLIEALMHHCADRSLLWITHRLSGLQKMDEILLMQQGKLIERGTPSELAATDSHYARMLEYHRSLNVDY
ncbi:MAG: thiol reductant ABC exporter subunit CydC [gamma proteobacterium symbiont of Stewartia floridana]|nr:MAG: thiol reductant ABC exporter subunit CydC [gamma proteobacterium symbiont of Stewartia floridana]RLW69623.1 MAG: thiol reductant ABC exporter subunit CydC [gamma proteobacterium symbiont of Stewartia floridana]